MTSTHPEITMNRNTWLLPIAAATLASAVLAPPSAGAQTLDATASAAHEEGVVLYLRAQYPQALQRLRVAAQKGDTQAAELLGLMYLVGERLYGPGVPTDLSEARRWLRQAANQGSRAAVHPLHALVSMEPPIE